MMELTPRILERIACELAKLIEAHKLTGELSPLAKKWIKIHKKQDKMREKNK